MRWCGRKSGVFYFSSVCLLCCTVYIMWKCFIGSCFLHLRCEVFHQCHLLSEHLVFLIYYVHIVSVLCCCRENLGGRVKVLVSGGALLPNYLESFFVLTGMPVSFNSQWNVLSNYSSLLLGSMFLVFIIAFIIALFV